MNQENYILEALEIVMAWDLPDEDLADAVTAQAKLMAGFDPWEDLSEIHRPTLSHNPFLSTFPSASSNSPRRNRLIHFGGPCSRVISGNRRGYFFSGDRHDQAIDTNPSDP